MKTASSKLFAPEVTVKRKSPQQQRSEQTVQRIKQAMLDIIAREGYSAASTNRIAKRARVNISSIYQYFPNREAIALAMVEDASLKLAQIIHDQLLRGASLTLEQSIRGIVECLVDFIGREQMALLRLAEDVPELRESGRALSLETLAYRASRVYLAQFLDQIDDETLARKLFFVQNFGMGLIRQYVLTPPPGLSREDFLDEITDLVVTYLRKPTPERQR